jgi:GntR family transcriptional regulator, transcriptional repressor for pyruvate dehydrogenase complex
MVIQAGRATGWSVVVEVASDPLRVTSAAVDGFRALPPRSTLPEEIADRLLNLIRDQQLRPGDRLPAERELARRLGVSRPVLREALRALSLMKVVDIRQGTGTYVTSLEPRQLISHLDFAFSSDTVALAKVFEARRVVELGNVRLAARRISDDDLARLAVLFSDLSGALDDAQRFSELDIAFHDAICAAADNFMLAQFMTIVDTLGRVSRQRTGGRREVRETAAADHRRILDALRARNPGAAERAMRAHLDHIEAAFRTLEDAAAEVNGERQTATGRARPGRRKATVEARG